MNLACPYCGNTVFPDEAVCPHCGGLLQEDPGATAVQSPYDQQYAANAYGGGYDASGYGAGGYDADATMVDSAAAPAHPAARPNTRGSARGGAMPQRRAPSVANRAAPTPSRPRPMRKQESAASAWMMMVVFAAAAVVLLVFTIKFFDGGGPKPKSFDDPIDNPGAADPALSGMVMIYSDMPSVGEVRMIFLTPQRLGDGEIQNVIKSIGKNLNQRATARTVISDFGNAATYDAWRANGAAVQLIFTDNRNRPEGYHTAPFRLQSDG